MEFIILLLALGFVTLIGHGIWVLLAWFFRALAGQGTSSPKVPDGPTDHRKRCSGCGQLLLPGQEACAKCGLERHSQTATELHELAIAARQLASFQQAGTLDSPTFVRVQSCIEARRKALLVTQREPVAPPAEPPKQLPAGITEQPRVLPIWERLQQLLESAPDVSSLALKQRQQALLWYPQLAEEQLASLSPAAQLALARLLRQVRKTDDSLRAYRRLLDRYPNDPEWAGWALEAGRLAADKKITDQACEFLEKASSRAASPEQGQEIGRLLQSLRMPPSTEIADVIPVPERRSAATLAMPRPRRSVAEVLAAFMEERNIFWGELIGGMLMVGCSIALAIYLWKDLERIPYFQFLIFVSTTAGLFGAGLYARHRLKLETTSRGLLVIATLLVPLNFLVMAGLAGQKAVVDPFDTVLRVGIELVSLAVFAGLMHWAARALLPSGRGLLILAVLGASASQLAVPRLLGLPAADHPPGLLSFALLSCLPVAFYGVGTGSLLYQLSARQPIEEREARSFFAFLGMAAFPLIVALGFLVYWSSDRGVALQRLAVLTSLSGVPVLAGGLLVHRRLQVTSPQNTASAGAIRTSGTAVALAGMLVMLAAVVLAWPQPVAMILVCALNFTVLTAIAFYFREPVAQAIALPCLAIGYLIAFHLLGGHLSSGEPGAALVRQLFSAQSGSALALFVLLLGVAAKILVRAGRRDQAVCYAAGAGAAALASLLLVNAWGVRNPGSATVITGAYGAASLALNLRWRRTLVSYVGLALLLGTTLWALWWTNAALTPAWGTVLAFEALLMAAVAMWAPGRALTRAAWRDMAAVAAFLGMALALASLDSIASTLHSWTGGTLAATAFLFAWSYRAKLLTWAGSALLLVTLLHAFTWSLPGLHLAHPSAVALLMHATLLVLASLLPKAMPGKQEEAVDRERANVLPFSGIFLEPLFQSAFASSLAVLPLVFAVAWADIHPLTIYLGWLSSIWLVIAWCRRWPLLFAAFQAALCGTVFLAATTWLEHQPWVMDHYPEALGDPRSLQTYGIALGLLGWLWLGARFALRQNAVARRLLEPAWPAVDWVVLGILVLGQLSLAIWGIVPGILGELTPIGTPLAATWPTEHVVAYGFGAWILLGVLAIALIVALWEREQAAALLGLVILAVTASLLISGPFEEELATASSLRWALGICFLACSIPLWIRSSLTRLAGRLNCSLDPTAKLSLLARGLLIAGTVFPVLGLTFAVAVIGFSGQQPTGPRSGSFFDDVGWVTSNVLPLAMLSLGLVGHALRERSPGYAFFAGLVVNLAVTGGYALGLVTSGQALGEVEWVRLLQWGSVTAALWAIAWLASRPWITAWREDAGSHRATSLMTVQLGLAAVGNAWLLVVALALLIRFFTTPAGWTTEAGSPLGWLALVLATGAWGWRREQLPSRVQPYTAGLIMMAALGLLACSVARQWPEWGYRALMLGWAGFAPALVWAAWVREGNGTRAQVGGSVDHAPAFHSLPLFLSGALTPHAVAFWVRVVVVLVILLGLNALLVHEADHLWAAAAIALASSSGAAMAVWRRREDWAFTAGLGVNLAASLVVWHFRQQAILADWWVMLLQANVLASACVALLWLGARKQLYGQAELRLATGPLLALQVCLGIAGNIVLLCGPLFWFVTQPGESLPAELLPVGYLEGWLALGLAVAAAYWHASEVAPGQRGHVLPALGMALGVLAACSASLWAVPGSWVAYHVLMAAWMGTGLSILAAERIAPLQDGTLAEFSPFPRLAQLLAFSPSELRAWLNGIGLLVLGLALRGTWEDPTRPYWSAGATVAVSAMAGAVALRSHLPVYAHISGLLLNVAGSMLWVAWGPSTPASFAYTHVLCFALASGIWSALELTLPLPRTLPSPPAEAEEGSARGSLPGDAPGRFFAFRHVAILYALGLLGGLVAWSVASDVLSAGGKEGGSLPWAALGATVVALVFSLWDREARFSLSSLYAAGLATIGLALHTLDLEPKDLGLTAALALAFYILLTTALARLAPRLPGLWQEFHMPSRPLGWPEAWFLPAQAAVAMAAVMLSVWLSLGAATLEERLAGPLAVGILLSAGALLAGGMSEKWALTLRHATLVLGILLVTEAGWAVLGPFVPSLWLHRNVLWMAALALMTLIYGVGLVRVLPLSSGWTGCARQLGPVLGACACLLLVLVLGHEAFLYNLETGRTAMMPWAIILVTAALAGLIAAGIGFAILPGREPFGLSERGRTLYVYAGELLLVSLFVHVRLTVPEFFRLGIFAQYWTFIVMAIAFVGVGLSEWFSRKGLRVLAEPLERTGVFLPLLPLLSFWVLPAAQAQTHRLLDPANYGRYAALWFLAGSLYTLVAVTRRSFRFALSAALAANFGLWALLVHSHLDFLTHPQMWLIPFALLVLVAEHINRERLTEQQADALRYVALLVIYLSSTADMFIAGLGQSVILPLILAVLSVLGVLSGILLRVRAFLYLGVTFLFLVVFTMIWHAAVGRHQIWVWWTSGIVLGAAIITLFAIFEKRRNDVLRVIEEIKEWD